MCYSWSIQKACKIWFKPYKLDFRQVFLHVFFLFMHIRVDVIPLGRRKPPIHQEVLWYTPCTLLLRISSEVWSSEGWCSPFICLEVIWFTPYIIITICLGIYRSQRWWDSPVRPEVLWYTPSTIIIVYWLYSWMYCDVPHVLLFLDIGRMPESIAIHPTYYYYYILVVRLYVLWYT